jgi:Fe2+ transport system protein FeoA
MYYKILKNMSFKFADQMNRSKKDPFTRLVDLNIGEKGRIKDIRGGRMAIQRLYDLGLTIGTVVAIKNKAIFGGPVELLVRGSDLALGRGIAAKIIVQRLS